VARRTIISVLLIEGIPVSSTCVETLENARSESESLADETEGESSPAHLILSFSQVCHAWYAVALPCQRTL